jgi:hypothetical protein
MQISESFNPSALAPFIRRAIRAPISLSWSIEKQSDSGALHVHVMLVIDAKHINPLSAFYQVRKALTRLKGVSSISIFKRKDVGSIIHNLNKYDEYLDSIYRFSYHAKTKSKDKVPESFVRTFGTSPVNDKYFYIYEDIMKPKITLARKNDSLKFISSSDQHDQSVNFRYQECRRCTYCFHMQDRGTSENMGFLGLDIESDQFEDEIHLYVNVESVYIKPEYRGRKHSLLFVAELSQFVSKAMTDTELQLAVGQKIYVANATSPMSCGSDMFVSMIEDAIADLCTAHELSQM